VTGEAVCIDLLRHGEVMGGVRFRGSQDDPLTSEGWTSMLEAVERGGPWDGVISSPLSRCRAFAESWSRTRGLPLEIDARLREYHFGEWEGRGYGELLARSPLALARFRDDPLRHPPPGAEPLADFQARTLAVLEDLSHARHQGRRWLVITHGGVIRMLLCHQRRWPVARIPEIDVPYASLHRLRWTPP
jgi:broad specificity phosphatase PhoE